MDRISVIVPVYKVEAYLCRCIDSILGQSYENFELILVDDGSPDNCGFICDTYAEQDSRIHVIHQENAGVSAARNAGLEWVFANSDSEWIAFVDSDDWIHKDYLNLLISMTEKHNVQIALCGCQWTGIYKVDPEYSDVEMIVLDPEDAFVQHYEKCMPPWSKLIHKSLMKDLRFPVGMRYEDAYITHVLTLSANQVAVCREPLYYYFCNPESFTRDKWTEVRLVAVQVHEQRLTYLLESRHQQAYHKEQEFFLEILTGNLQSLMHLLNEGEIYQRNFQQLRERHRQVFREVKARGNLKFKWETMWFYFFAIPTDIAWKIARVAQEVYHKLKD